MTIDLGHHSLSRQCSNKHSLFKQDLNELWLSTTQLHKQIVANSLTNKVKLSKWQLILTNI